MEISSDEFQKRLYKAAEKRLNAKVLADSAPECSFLLRPPGAERSFVHGIGAAQIPRHAQSEIVRRSLSPSPIKSVLLKVSNEVSTTGSPNFFVSKILETGKGSDSLNLMQSGDSGTQKLTDVISLSPEPTPLESNERSRLIPSNRKSWDNLRGSMKIHIGNGSALDTIMGNRHITSKSESPEQSGSKSANSWLLDLSAPDRTTKSYMRNTLLSENRRQIHTERVRQRGEPANWPWWKQTPLQPDDPIPVPLSADDPTYSPEV